MESVRKGLRTGELEKDSYGRLNCVACGVEVETKNDPDAVGKVRACPSCGDEWKELG